jgi:uncharacterized membrane protein
LAHNAFSKNSNQLDNFNWWSKFYNILTTINFNTVVSHDLSMTFPSLIPSLGVLASQSIAYRNIIQLIYNPLSPLLDAKLYPYNIST